MIQPGMMRQRVVRSIGLWATACLVLSVPACSQAPANNDSTSRESASEAPASQATASPTAVTTAFQQAYPTATISSTKQEREKDRTLFRVEGADTGRLRSVLYEANGKVVEVGDQVEEAELPKPVFDAIHAHRRAIFVSALKVTRGADVEYRITVRGSRRTAMVAKADGTVVSFE